MKKWIEILMAAVCSMSVWAADGVTEISQLDMAVPPYVITQSGSYVLTENLIVTNTDKAGIEVQAHHVSIDLNGFMLKGPGSGHSSSNGIQQLEGYENLTVRNGSVFDWAGGAGISAAGMETVLEDLHVMRNLTGICILNRGMIRNVMVCTNLADGIGGGWGTGSPSAVQVEHGVVSGNGGNGITAADGAWRVKDCRCDFNGFYGIYLTQGSVGDSSASYNQFGGIPGRPGKRCALYGREQHEHRHSVQRQHHRVRCPQQRRHRNSG